MGSRFRNYEVTRVCVIINKKEGRKYDGIFPSKKKVKRMPFFVAK